METTVAVYSVLAAISGMMICCIILLLKRLGREKLEEECGWECCGTLHGGWVREPEEKLNPARSDPWMFTDNTIDARYSKKATLEVKYDLGEKVTKTKVIRPVVPNRNYLSFTQIQQSAQSAGFSPV